MLILRVTCKDCGDRIIRNSQKSSKLLWCATYNVYSVSFRCPTCDALDTIDVPAETAVKLAMKGMPLITWFAPSLETLDSGDKVEIDSAEIEQFVLNLNDLRFWDELLGSEN